MYTTNHTARSLRSEGAANAAMQAACASIGANWAKPAPKRAARTGIVARVLRALGL